MMVAILRFPLAVLEYGHCSTCSGSMNVFYQTISTNYLVKRAEEEHSVADHTNACNATMCHLPSRFVQRYD